MASKKNGISKEYDVQPHDLTNNNSVWIRHALASIRMPALDIRDVDAVRERIMWYFETCADNNMVATVAGMANALGVTRATLVNWGNQTRKKNVPEYQEAVQDGMGVITELMETMMLTGKINPVAGIFLMKNNLGYTDTTEISLQNPNDGDRDVSAQALKDRYGIVPEDNKPAADVIDAEIVTEEKAEV